MASNPRRATRLQRPRHASAAARERGSTALETAVVMPVVLALFFIGMQGALLYMGRSTATAAAQEGARVAALENGSVADGEAAAASLANDASIRPTSINVTGSRDATRAQMDVAITTLSVVPGWTPTVSASASAPVERITGP